MVLCVWLQASLNKLMETLEQSEPYFVKCIRSNAEKVITVYDSFCSNHFLVLTLLSLFLRQLPLRFNDSLVLRQLRYTGMLETVRIRQSGYSIKYTFQVRTFTHNQSSLDPVHWRNFDFEDQTLPSCDVVVAGLCAPLSRADASWHDSNQIWN